MKTLAKPLLKLTAADLMSDPVVMIPEEMSLRKAAHLLVLNRISGAPVIDPWGTCIGVLSATDFIRWADGSPTATLLREPATEAFTESWMVEPERVPEYPVRKYMTKDPVTVSPGRSIVELSRMMLDAHIHRVIVVNEASHPIGIVSATDILAALAYAGR
jgi:CBS-domain-containing membrane protein